MKVLKLIDNIIDQMIEAQIKLGYSKETITLYYPLESLNRMLGTAYENGDTLSENLVDELEKTNHPLGRISVRANKKRIGVTLSSDAGEYVYKNIERPKFLVALIQLFERNHHCTIEEISELFGRYSTDFRCDKMPEDGEFDYVLYFPNQDVDSYYYCVRREMGHTIYHRFLEEDYKQLL